MERQHNKNTLWEFQSSRTSPTDNRQIPTEDRSSIFFMRQRHLTQMKRQTTSTTPLIRSWKSKHITPLCWGTLMRKLEDNQIHHKGRQDASAWASEMKEETNHCLILYRHLTCSSWLVLQNASTRQKTLP